MRLFLALELPNNIKQEIADQVGKLKKLFSLTATWVKTDNLHVTLGFIGEVADKAKSKLISSLKQDCQNLPTFYLSISNLVCLPKHHPRVLAINTHAGREFNLLQYHISLTIKKLNLPIIIQSAHLTLARLKTALPPNFTKDHSLFLKPIKYQVQHFTLFQSLLGMPKGFLGPIYMPIARFKLSPTPTTNFYRPNIVICVLNSENKILVIYNARRPNHWQLPQGGIENNESLKSATLRELREEVGITQVKILIIQPNAHSYKFPATFSTFDPDINYNYIGQQQSLAIVKTNQLKPLLKLDPQEAAAAKWVNPNKLLATLHPLRRKLGKIVLNEVCKLI